MNEDVKAYLIVIGAFIVSIVSFLSDLLDKDIHRRIESGKANWFDKKLCCLLKKLEDNHCAKSIGE